MAAVAQRARTGEGAELRLALSDVVATLSHLGLMVEAELLGQDRPSLGNYIYGAFGRDFDTADGQRVQVAGISTTQWIALCKACELDTTFAVMDETSRFNARELIAHHIEKLVFSAGFFRD